MYPDTRSNYKSPCNDKCFLILKLKREKCQIIKNLSISTSMLMIFTLFITFVSFGNFKVYDVYVEIETGDLLNEPQLQAGEKI